MNTGICYLYGAGTYYSDEIAVPGNEDMVIAADGGYDFLKKHNIIPDMLLGDFDSLSSSDYITNAEDNHIPVLSFPKDKDYTDMYLAAEEGMKHGYKTFHIYGGCGGRIDHTIANIQLLSYITKKGCSGWLFANNSVLTIINDSSLNLTKDKLSSGYISVLSYSDVSYGVTISGLKYETDNITMTNSMVLGTSNEFIGKDCSISVQKGTLLIIIEL